MARFYADTVARRTRQLTADLGFVVWSLVWMWAATNLYDLVMQLAGPGEVLTSAGEELSQSMLDAGATIDGLPVVGDAARAPFDRMSDAAQSIADAGRTEAEAVGRVALFGALCLAVLPIATYLLVWLPLRVRFVRRASAAQRFIDTADDLDLFALRALARQPMHTLARIDDDPAGAWRRRDPRVVRALAELELREEGLTLPPAVP